jgi:hypothetical protein
MKYLATEIESTAVGFNAILKICDDATVYAQIQLHNDAIIFDTLSFASFESRLTLAIRSRRA